MNNLTSLVTATGRRPSRRSVRQSADVSQYDDLPCKTINSCHRQYVGRHANWHANHFTHCCKRLRFLCRQGFTAPSLAVDVTPVAVVMPIESPRTVDV